MVTTTVVLQGHLIQAGVRFLWWVVDGSPSTVTVSHAALGTRSAPVDGDPEQSARALARHLLDQPYAAEEDRAE